VGHQHRFSALQVRVAGHHGFASGVRLFDKRTGPRRKRFDDEADLLADVEGAGRLQSVSLRCGQCEA